MASLNLSNLVNEKNLKIAFNMIDKVNINIKKDGSG